jgi:hypothetical protein
LWTLPGIIAQPIFCNDFEYVGCAEDTLQPITTYNIRYGGTDDGIFYCTTDSTRCVIDGISSSSPYSPAKVKVYGGDCWKNWLNYWECSNWIKDCTGSCEVQAGQRVIPDSLSVSYTARKYRYRLFWCGKSSCAAQMAGTPVAGASGCSFVPSTIGVGERVYDDNGNLLDPDYKGLYTVPPGRSYQYTSYSLRRVCGNTGETCESNSDCADMYPYKINYGGDWYGVTFSAGQMLFYGCKKTEQVCMDKDIGQNIDECLQYNQKSYCDTVIFSGVECIPDSDTCGPSAVCKQTGPTSFECVPYDQKECDYNWQCGQAISCDWSTIPNTLKQPVCQGGRCATLDTPVECCYDTNCPSNYYCDSDHTCKERVVPKAPCPYTCCVDEADYIDKPCPSSGDTFCCPDNTCAISQEYCEGVSQFDINMLMIAMILFFGVIGGLVGYLLKGLLGAIILALVGILLGYLAVALVLPIIQQILDMMEVSVNILDALIFWN